MYQTDLLYGFSMPDHLTLNRQWLARAYPKIREGALYIDADGSAIQVFYGAEPLIVPTSLTSQHVSISPEDYSQLEHLAQYVKAIYLDMDQIPDYLRHEINMFRIAAVITADYFTNEELGPEQILNAQMETLSI